MNEQSMYAPQQTVPPQPMAQAPVYTQPVKQKKPRKPFNVKKFLIILGIVLAVTLVVGFILIWYFRAWFFAPRLDMSSFSTEVTFVDEPTSPSDGQMQALADYVNALRDQSYRRMSFSERDGAKKLESVIDCLSSDDPDMEQMLRDIGADIQRETASQDQLFRYMTQQTSAPTGTAETTIDLPGASSRDLVDSFPATVFHDSTQLRLSSKNAESRTCRYCGHVNPPAAEKCEECGALLITPQTVYVEDLEPAAAGGDGLTEAERTAYMLNNVSSTLLLANRPTTALYLTCLACAKDPSNVSSIVSLVTQLRMRERPEEALALCNLGLALDPSREELFVHAGNICVQLDRPEDALKYYGRCLAMNTSSGPMSQAAMFAYLQKKDYVNAFRCMLEGARDGYTSQITIVYDILRMRADYYDFAGEVFKNYSVRTLMDFSMNRSGFNPANELSGKVVDIGAVKVPSTAADWLASAKSIIQNGQNYFGGAIEFYKEDIRLIADVYDILLNANDLKDLAKGFMGILGDRVKKEELTESERIISFEQERFWLDILDDFQEWKIDDIRAKMNEELEHSDFEGFMRKMEEITERNHVYLESLDLESIPGMVAGMEWAFERVDNSSVLFSESESAQLIPKVENALRVNGNVRNKAYQEIAEVAHDYFMFANTILGMVADKDMYQEYRQEITLRVVTAQTVCIAENMLCAYVVPVMAEPYLMLGKQAQEGITDGAITGKCPPFPKFIISDKPPRPSADMYADIEIPDISAITADVLGIDLLGQADTGNKDYPAMKKIWEMYWKEKSPGIADSDIPAPPNFSDSLEREKFWNSLTPEQRMRYSRVVADPDVVKRTVVLDVFCPPGHGVFTFKEENVGWLSGLSSSVNAGGYGVSMGADGTYSGRAKLGIGTLSMDSRGNVGFSIDDNPSGIKFGVQKTGRDITTYVGTDFGLKFKYKGKNEDGSSSGGSASVGGVGANAEGQVYGTYSLGEGKWTSGGMKVGAKAVMAGIIGLGTSTNVNMVQGLSTTEIYMVLGGKKLTYQFKQDYNYQDKRETNNVPGLQEFHK